MAHGELICRTCFEETGMKTMNRQSKTDTETTEFVCPNCGSTSFGI